MCRVGKQEAGLEITEFLMRRFPFRSVSAWEKRLASGLVTQGERALKPGDRLLPEPPLRFANPAQHEPSVPDEAAVLDKTDDYLLVYKPAPLPVHPGGRYNRNTLTAILGELVKEDAQPLLVLHRLDSVTSGLVLFGRNHVFSRIVQRALARGEAEKTYLAMVWGSPADNRMTVDSPIRRKHGYVFECHKGGKASLTDFEVVRRLGACSLVRCHPRTGRTHQIRLHLREWGHPVIDDQVYGRAGAPEPSAISGNFAESAGSLDYVPGGGTRKCTDDLLAGDAGAVIQNRPVSLLHSRLQIPQEGLDFRLSDHFTESIEPESHDAGQNAGLPVPAAFATAGLHFLLD